MRTINIDGHGPCEVWNLPKMSSPKQRRYRYTPESFTHPAKMNVVICRKIVNTYTKLGDILLDPMCGVSTTQIEAALLGRNAIGVDLEGKFVKLSRKNIRLLKKLRTLAPKGEAVVLKGDARKLSELMSKQADSIIFSPPYAKSEPAHDLNFQMKRQLQGKLSKGNVLARYEHQKGIGSIDKPYGSVDAVVFSPPYLNAREGGGANKHPERYPTLRGVLKRKGGLKESEDPKSIGNLPQGQIDAIITSPPYSESLTGKRDVEKEIAGWEGRQPNHPRLKTLKRRSEQGSCFVTRDYSQSDKNIGNLPHGQVDAIVTSPPYSEGTGHGGGRDNIIKEKHLYLYGKGSYSEGKGNIGHLKHGQVDAIVTSPPYHDNKSDWDRKSRAAEEGEAVTYSDEVGNERKNIGNIHYYNENEPLSHKYSKSPKGKETYLSAMLQVYAECFKVLKPGGLMVLVVKDFIRNKKVVRLDLDTKRLCEAAGFRWVETKLFRLPSKSFWRVLYEQKHPEVDTSLIRYEFVEVFEKPLEVFA